MSSVPPDRPDPSAGPAPGSAPDDTAAFSRFYLGDPDVGAPTPAAHGVVYRLFVGWWRDR